jgi:hypothetical protein
MSRTAAALLLLAPVAFAAAPDITELQPRGASLGRPFTLTAIGKNLGESARVSSTLPATFTLLTPSEKDLIVSGPGRSASFLVELAPTAAPGVYPIRIELPSGISNVLLFTLGTFPETAEQESGLYAPPHHNDSIETAEPISGIPMTVNGTLRGAERDMYRVQAKRGESRVIEVEARRCGSAIDPVLRILDGSGRQLARSNDTGSTGLDARIDFTFPRDDYYYVEVTDARFSTQTQNFYRLKIGDYAYPEGIFPLGGSRGSQVPVTFFGGRLAKPVQTMVDLRNVSSTQPLTTAALMGSPALPFVFAVSDLTELLEPVQDLVPVPSVVNARLMKEGEVDRYRFKVSPGDKLLFEIEARELGTSRLEGVITAYDPSGKKLDSAGDKPLAEDVFAVQGTSRTSSDPFLNVTVPAGVEEITLSIEDLALRGGPLYGYRLIARRQPEEFHLTINSPYLNIPAGGSAMITVSADRRGYDGPIQLSIPDLPKGLHVEGGMIPREFVDENNLRTLNRRGILTITADPGVELPLRELSVWGEGQLADGAQLRRRAHGSGMMVEVAGATAQGVVDRQRAITAPILGFDLPAAVAGPAVATLDVRQTGIKQMEEGARYEYEYKWNLRMRGLTPPSKVNADVIGARDLRVIDMTPSEDETSGTFAITTTKATDPARYDLYISAKLKTEAGDELIVSRPIAFEVTGPSTHVSSNR